MSAIFMANDGMVQRVLLDDVAPVSIRLLAVNDNEKNDPKFGRGFRTDAGLERSIDGASDDFAGNEGMAIITGVSMQHGTNHQFTRSLGRDVYLYTFGEKIGDIVVEGLCFASSCIEVDKSRHGFWHALRFYVRNRISNRNTLSSEVNGGVLSSTSGVPRVQLAINGKSIIGYLTGVSVNLNDTGSYITSFRLSISTIGDALVD